MGWIRFVDRQALHRPHGSLAVHLKYKKTYLTRVFGLRHSICSNPFFRFGSRSQVTNWKGDLAIVFLFWPDFRKYICDLFFLPQVSTCREGKLGGFFFLSSECSSWFLSAGFSAVASPGSSHSCGCIVLFRPSLSLVNSWCDVSGRYMQVEFSFFGSSFRVCCVYAPNRNPVRDQFFGDLHSKINPSIPMILCGEFNEVFDRSVDRAGSDPLVSPRDSSSSLTYLFDDCCVVDIWRYLRPSSVGFTWTRWDGSLASRIDLFGVPFSWVPSVSSCSFVPCPFSDHCGVLLSCSIPDAVPPGPGIWKLNISVLDDPEYVELISNAWRSLRNSISRFPSLAKWWDGEKSLIKGLTIRYCCRKAGARSCLRDLLVPLIDHLKVKVDLGSSSCLGPYHSALAKLAALDSHVAKGAQVRSRVKWVEEGNLPHHTFSALNRSVAVIGGSLR